MARGEITNTPEDEARSKKVDLALSAEVDEAGKGAKGKKVAEEVEEADDFFEDE